MMQHVHNKDLVSFCEMMNEALWMLLLMSCLFFLFPSLYEI